MGKRGLSLAPINTYLAKQSTFRVVELRHLAKIIRARAATTGKGGVRRRLKKPELLREIRRTLPHTFPDSLQRFAQTAQAYLDQRPA